MKKPDWWSQCGKRGRIASILIRMSQRLKRSPNWPIKASMLSEFIIFSRCTSKSISCARKSKRPERGKKGTRIGASSRRMFPTSTMRHTPNFLSKTPVTVEARLTFLQSRLFLLLLLKIARKQAGNKRITFLSSANELAQHYNHSQIEPAHLLAALLNQEGGVVQQVIM